MRSSVVLCSVLLVSLFSGRALCGEAQPFVEFMVDYACASDCNDLYIASGHTINPNDCTTLGVCNDAQYYARVVYGDLRVFQSDNTCGNLENSVTLQDAPGECQRISFDGNPYKGGLLTIANIPPPPTYTAEGYYSCAYCNDQTATESSFIVADVNCNVVGTCDGDTWEYPSA
eukprot:TRINITY_DN26168_c0_g1_i1.p1 TRINITY_DN26168_c0_g1~~TRINITY_DN26168_c0_g1_i1.p1  ORF type:complete len:187 (-),score=17.38 TRINITY_DN26168_c0_g1_i1:69-587(-)